MSQLAKLNTNLVSTLGKAEKVLQRIKKVNPKDRYVALFPDSDNVRHGMGLNLLNCPSAEKVYSDASDILKRNMIKFCLDTPNDELRSSLESRNLVAFVTSSATMAKLREERSSVVSLCKAAGGIGVGFINSLVFSGSMSFEDGLDLVQKQSQAMDRAAKIVPTARILVNLGAGTRLDKVCRAAVEECLKHDIPREVAVCSVRKKLAQNVVEFAGHEEAIKYLFSEGERLFRFKRSWRIRETEAYNTNLMKPAHDFISLYIQNRLESDPNYIRDPTECSVYSSNCVRRLQSVRAIKKDLIDYPVKPVQVEGLLHVLFSRPRDVSQPNSLVMWDRRLLKTLRIANRLAADSAELVAA